MGITSASSIMASDSYWGRVKRAAKALKGDGCSSSPDLFYTRCCDEHDIHYRTGRTLAGKFISRAQSDKRLFACMKQAGRTPIVGKFLVPCVYWLGVRLFGRGSWKGR